MVLPDFFALINFALYKYILSYIFIRSCYVFYSNSYFIYAFSCKNLEYLKLFYTFAVIYQKSS
jgi:hypothetical protein